MLISSTCRFCVATQLEPDGKAYFLSGVECDGTEDWLASCFHDGWQDEEACPSEKVGRSEMRP